MQDPYQFPLIVLDGLATTPFSAPIHPFPHTTYLPPNPVNDAPSIK